MEAGREITVCLPMQHIYTEGHTHNLVFGDYSVTTVSLHPNLELTSDFDRLHTDHQADSIANTKGNSGKATTINAT